MLVGVVQLAPLNVAKSPSTTATQNVLVGQDTPPTKSVVPTLVGADQLVPLKETARPPRPVLSQKDVDGQDTEPR